MDLLTRYIIIVTVIVSVVDASVFAALKKKPQILTVPLLVLMILATVIPIAINLGYWLR
jgi:hypothetical protein